METTSYQYCGVCGQPLEPGATVCGNCGAAVEATGPVATGTAVGAAAGDADAAAAADESTTAMPAAAAAAGARQARAPREEAATVNRHPAMAPTRGCPPVNAG